ncbi:MAG: OsmC family protein [Anaerolineales bacterium]|jgi:putative redox protein
MNATVTWRQGLSFTGKADSGYKVPLGAEPEVGVSRDGFEPLELMAVSLAGCTAMDVISILTKKKQKVTEFEVKVKTERATEFPKVFTHAVITYLVTGHGVDETAVVRSMELSATKYCPAQAMLGKVFPIELIYEIYEDEGNGKKRLAKKGTYRQPDVFVQAKEK